MADNWQHDEDGALWAIGLMSGTSLDGVDAALIRTDGKHIYERGPALTIAYDASFHEELELATRQTGDIAAVEQEFTHKSIEAVEALLQQANMKPAQVAVIGFHGQTIDHRPDHGISWQIGNPALMAAETGIHVVSDFRRRDMAEGGQGAPLVPLYHAALARDLPKPVAVVNIGGMANVTWIDEETHTPWILAFDTGPGNVLMNALMARETGALFDVNGEVAASGHVDALALEGYLYDTYFSEPPPKSVDRYDFGLEPVLHLPFENAMATLLEFTVQSIVKAQDFIPEVPRQWVVAGGGANNPVLMARLQSVLGRVDTASAIGWDQDALEAQAFGYLAVRSLAGLPLTLPGLTGVHRPMTGGAFYRA